MSQAPINKASRATSTVYGDIAAIKHFDTFQQQRGDPCFDGLTNTDVEDLHLRKLMMDFSSYLAKTNIHKFNNPENSLIGVDGKQRIFGKVKEALKEKFLCHCEWEFENDWYKPLYSDLGLAVTKENMKSNDFFDGKTPGLYPVVSAEYVRMKNRELILHGESQYANDLSSMCLLLIMQSASMAQYQNGPLQQRAWIVMIMLAAARAGEL
jgi:hypothetical protein